MLVRHKSESKRSQSTYYKNPLRACPKTCFVNEGSALIYEFSNYSWNFLWVGKRILKEYLRQSIYASCKGRKRISIENIPAIEAGYTIRIMTNKGAFLESFSSAFLFDIPCFKIAISLVFSLMKIGLLRTGFSRPYCLTSFSKGYLEETELLLKHKRWTIFKPESIVEYGANSSCVLLAPSKLICCFLCSLNIISKVIREVMYEENFTKKKDGQKI